jgi:hypothetical protein
MAGYITDHNVPGKHDVLGKLLQKYHIDFNVIDCLGRTIVITPPTLREPH